MERLKIDRILDVVAKQSDLIVRSHRELDIPLEDLICAAVRRAANLKAIDQRQGELSLEQGEGK